VLGILTYGGVSYGSVGYRRFMPFVPRIVIARPKPVGRPPMPIPRQLRAILDETLRSNQAWIEDITDLPEADLRELLRLGTRYSGRLSLSFRHRITENDEGRRMLAMWIQPKQKYERKAR
jgi:hypothetical protein